MDQVVYKFTGGTTLRFVLSCETLQCKIQHESKMIMILYIMLLYSTITFLLLHSSNLVCSASALSSLVIGILVIIVTVLGLFYRTQLQ